MSHKTGNDHLLRRIQPDGQAADADRGRGRHRHDAANTNHGRSGAGGHGSRYPQGRRAGRRGVDLLSRIEPDGKAAYRNAGGRRNGSHIGDRHGPADLCRHGRALLDGDAGAGDRCRRVHRKDGWRDRDGAGYLHRSRDKGGRGGGDKGARDGHGRGPLDHQALGGVAGNGFCRAELATDEFDALKLNGTDVLRGDSRSRSGSRNSDGDIVGQLNSELSELYGSCEARPFREKSVRPRLPLWRSSPGEAPPSFGCGTRPP